MKSKARHVEGGGSSPIVHGRINGHLRFEKNREFTKDMHIHIFKPKLMETPMKSKARHIYGGVVPRTFMRTL